MGTLPLDDNHNAVAGGYDPVTHKPVALQVVSVTTDTTNNVAYGTLQSNATFSASSLAINDPTTTSQKMTVDAAGTAHVGIYQGANQVTVTQFHSGDNQSLGSGNGLLVGGVTQILNPGGLLDRQRGTGFDNIPAVGVATGTQQLAGSALTTTFNGAVTGNATVQSVVVASSSNLKVGDMVVTQDNQEFVEITAIADGTHATGAFTKNHANGQTLTWYHYNQARDATIGDLVGGTGLSPSATYLYNTFTGNFEYDRSANGERDGASGQGTSVAAEYEYNGGGPGAGNYDRARNLQGKGVTTNTLNGAASAGQNQAFLNSGSVPIAGQPIYLQGGTSEVAYVSTISGQTLTFTANLANTHANATNVQWDSYISAGPALTGFLPTGIGIEEEALYDPVSGLFYIERSATQDAVLGQNVVMENVALWNGTTMDRLKGDNTGAARTSLYGKSTVAGDTALSVDSSGRMQGNIAQWNGSAPGINNPVITEDQIRYWITNGQGFSGSTGKVTATITGTLGLSIFNPNASGKTLVIFSLATMNAQTHFDQINYTTSDPAMGTTVTPINLKAGGAASVTTCSFSNGATLTPAGTQVEGVGGLANSMTQVVVPGHFYVIPPNNGIAYYMNMGGTNQWNTTFRWVEI